MPHGSCRPGLPPCLLLPVPWHRPVCPPTSALAPPGPGAPPRLLRRGGAPCPGEGSEEPRPTLPPPPAASWWNPPGAWQLVSGERGRPPQLCVPAAERAGGRPAPPSAQQPSSEGSPAGLVPGLVCGREKSLSVPEGLGAAAQLSPATGWAAPAPGSKGTGYRGVPATRGVPRYR